MRTATRPMRKRQPGVWLEWGAGESLATALVFAGLFSTLLLARDHRGVRPIRQPQHQRRDDELDDHYQHEQQQQHCISMLLPHGSARQAYVGPA
jgi:hypothetical protein